MNVLFITADQFRGDCLSAAGHPVVRDAEPRPARRGRGVVPAPLRQRGAVRAEPGVALHRHVPVQPPGCDQRLAARRPLHELRAARPARSATSPRCSATPTSASTPAPCPPTIRGCTPTKACSRASTRSATCPRATRRRGSRGCEPRATTCPSTGARSSTGLPTGTRVAHAVRRRAQPDRVPDRSSARLRRRPRATARGSCTSPTCGRTRRTSRPRRTTRCTTPRRCPRPCARATRAEEGAQHPLLGVMIDHPLVKVARRRSSATRVPGDVLRDGVGGRHATRPVVRLRSTRWASADDTLVVFTSDHGELLGDHWLVQKIGWFDTAYHVPLIVRDPRSAFDATRGTDGGSVHRARRRDADDLRAARRRRADAVRRPLTRPLARGRHARPVARRRAPRVRLPRPRQPRCSKRRSASRWRSARSRCCATTTGSTCSSRGHHAFPPLFFDIDDDPGAARQPSPPTPRTRLAVLDYAQRMLAWRMRHTDRTLAGMKLTMHAGLVERHAPRLR